MSETDQQRQVWDEKPPNEKKAYLYEWNKSLQQEVDTLTKKLHALESRLKAIEAR